MEKFREIKLESGAILKVAPSSFAASKALYQAVMKELKDSDDRSNVRMLIKDFICISFSSPLIESCLKECFKRCTLDSGLGDMKIDDSTFEPVERRNDYVRVCVEVAKENISPFMNSLYAECLPLLAMIDATQK